MDVFEQSGANKPKLGTIVTPTSTISPEEMVRPQLAAAEGLRGMGRALDEIGDRLDMAAVPEAQQAGLAAVGRDENGQPTVQLRPFAFSRSDAAFNAAARQGLLSMAQMDAQRGLQEIAAKHALDPAGFEAEAKGYVKGLGAGAKDMRPQIQADAEKLANQHFLSISNRKVAQAQENAKIAVTTQIQDSVNTIYALARQGGTSTPEWTEAFEKVQGLYKQLQDNPAFGFPAERVSSELARIRSQAFGEMTVGEVDRTYTRRGKAEAQKYLTEKILNNPDLNLSNSERSQLYNSGLARLQYLDGETKAQVEAHRKSVSTIVDGLQKKIQIPDAQIDEAISTASKLGDAESVLKLNAARAIYNVRRQGAGLSDEQAVRLYAGIGGGAQPAPTAPGEISTIITNAANKYGLSPQFMARVAHIESRFDPNAMNAGSKATGLFQFIPSTWRQYGGGADPRDPAANADAAARLAVANRNQLRASLGRDPTEGELYLAHQQGAGGAAKLLSNPGARAVDVVGERAVLGNGGNINMTAGQFAQLWIRKLDGASGQPVPAPAGTTPGAPPSPFTPAQIAANPFLGSQWIQAQIGDQKEMVDSATKVAQAISAGIDKGNLPNADTLASVLQVAEQFPDQMSRVRDELVAKVQGFDDAWQALGQPSSAGRDLVRQSQQRAQGAPIIVQQRAEAMKEAYDRGVKALAETPWEEAARRGWSSGPLPALDFTSAEALSAGLMARQNVASSISARTGEAQSVLSPGDVADMQAVFRGGAPEQRTMVVSQLAQLPTEQFNAIVTDPTIRDSLIGMSRSGDVTKMAPAFALMDRAQRADPDGFSKAYGRDVENRLGAWTSRMQYMSPEELARETQRENDPAVKKAKDELRSQAEEKVKKLTASDIAGYFDASWLPFSSPSAPSQPEMAARFAADYKQEYAETFAAVGDEAKSRELAVQRLGRLWAPSIANGGELMKFAPEKSAAYPTVNGSHAWLEKQIDNDVRTAVANMGGLAFNVEGPGDLQDPAWVEQPGARGILRAPRRLVADARTESEFSSGQRPSYQVIVQAPNGMFVPLTNAQGQPLRFVGDPDAAVAENTAEVEKRWGEAQASKTARERVEADAIRRRDNRQRRRQENQ